MSENTSRTSTSFRRRHLIGGSDAPVILGNDDAALLQRKSVSLAQQDIVSPKGCYVYAIYVDGVLRYIGKGTNGRMYAHMKEVRQRLTRKFKLRNVSPRFQQKLTEAVIKGARVEEIIIADNLTSKQAYQLEHRRMEEMVHDGKRGQLWNVVPPSIYTPQEYEEFVQRLLKTSRSKNRLARYFARMGLARLASNKNGERLDGASQLGLRLDQQPPAH